MKATLFLAVLAGVHAQNSVNKIVSLLQGMEATVKKEGAEAEKLWTEHSEWYRSEKQATEYGISDATDALNAAQACASESAAKAAQEAANIEELAGKLAKNADDLSAAQKLRAEENADFTKAQQELVDTVDTLVRAAAVIRRATGGSGSSGSAAKLKKAFTQVAASLSTVMEAAYIDADDRSRLSALLQQGQQAESEEDDYVEPTAAVYSEHSTNIVDLLVELKQKAEAELSALRKEESEKQHAFNMLKQSLNDATRVYTSDKATATSNNAQQSEENGKCTGEASAQAKTKSESEDYLANLVATYKQDSADHAERSKDRAGELEAIAKAVEILSGASEAFKRRDVLIQTHQAPDVRSEVLQVLKAAASRLGSYELAQVATSAAQDPFGKVKGLIADMIARLQKQASEEADHKAYCDSEKRKNEAKRDDRSGKLDNYSARLEKAKSEDAQLKQDVAQLSGEISESDAGFQAATKLRGEENAAFNSLMADTRTGLDALSQAISVLKDYYGNAKAHAEKSDSGSKVISFLEVAQSDMIKMKTEGEEAEKNAVEAFNKMKNEYEQMRASKTASIKGKEQEGSRLGGMIADLENDVSGTSEELDNTLAYLEKLKGSCVHKVMSFEERAAKMQQEIASLQQALDILENETAASFLQRRV